MIIPEAVIQIYNLLYESTLRESWIHIQTEYMKYCFILLLQKRPSLLHAWRAWMFCGWQSEIEEEESC